MEPSDWRPDIPYDIGAAATECLRRIKDMVIPIRHLTSDALIEEKIAEALLAERNRTIEAMAAIFDEQDHDWSWAAASTIREQLNAKS